MGAVNGPGRLIRGTCDACLLSFPPSRPEISRWRCARGMAHRRRRRPAGFGERVAPARLEPAEAVEEPTGSATALRASARSRCPPPSPRFPRPWQAVSAARPGQEGSRMRASSLRLMAGFKLAAHGLRGLRTASRASSWRLEALLAARTPPSTPQTASAFQRSCCCAARLPPGRQRPTGKSLRPCGSLSGQALGGEPAPDREAAAAAAAAEAEPLRAHAAWAAKADRREVARCGPRCRPGPWVGHGILWVGRRITTQRGWGDPRRVVKQQPQQHVHRDSTSRLKPSGGGRGRGTVACAQHVDPDIRLPSGCPRDQAARVRSQEWCRRWFAVLPASSKFGLPGWAWGSAPQQRHTHSVSAAASGIR